MTDMLNAPWREEYILGTSPDYCIFCDPETHPEVAELMLHRGTTHFIVMNRYPYNSGHLMVVPYRHIARLEQLTAEERGEMMELVALSERAIERALQPQGINVGMNLGRPAGAGIDRHLHMHLVPRWTGDTNFMPVLGGARVHSVDLQTAYDALVRAYGELASV